MWSVIYRGGGVTTLKVTNHIRAFGLRPPNCQESDLFVHDLVFILFCSEQETDSFFHSTNAYNKEKRRCYILSYWWNNAQQYVGLNTIKADKKRKVLTSSLVSGISLFLQRKVNQMMSV